MIFQCHSRNWLSKLTSLLTLKFDGERYRSCLSVCSRKKKRRDEETRQPRGRGVVATCSTFHPNMVKDKLSMFINDAVTADE